VSLALAQPRDRAQLRPPLRALQECHYGLIAAYDDAFRRGSLLPGLLKGKAREGDADGFKASASGPITRVLLAAHIKDRMKLLGHVYVQLGRTIAPGEDPDYLQWLNDAAADCEAFERSLRSTTKALKGIRIPGLAILVGVVLQGSSQRIVELIGAGLILLPLLFLLVVAAWSAFRRKRELLLPGAYGLNAKDREVQTRHPGFNAYDAEEQLAKCLGYGKPREIQLDYLAIVAVSLIGLCIPVGLCLVLDLGALAITASAILLVGAWLAAIKFAAGSWQQRRWR
jgi:hypothetical protein